MGRTLPPPEPVPSDLVPSLFAPTQSDSVSLVERVAHLLWQVNQGAILAEDRAIGTNWFAEPIEQQHPDDQKERPGWIDLAETVIALVRAEIEAP